MLDMGGVPQRLEHDVGKAQRQQVLDGFLAQIVVDAEDAILGEGAATASFTTLEEGRSMPSGFSRPMRLRSLARPLATRPAMVGSNRLGAVERKIARPFSTVPTFSARAWKWLVSFASSGW
jgi:hypothetical protein